MGQIELELEHLRLKRIGRRARPCARRPKPHDHAGAAGAVRDATVQRLQREAARGIPGNQRMEPAPQPVDLDNVAGLDPFDSHRLAG